MPSHSSAPTAASAVKGPSYGGAVDRPLSTADADPHPAQLRAMTTAITLRIVSTLRAEARRVTTTSTAAGEGSWGAGEGGFLAGLPSLPTQPQFAD